MALAAQLQTSQMIDVLNQHTKKVGEMLGEMSTGKTSAVNNPSGNYSAATHLASQRVVDRGIHNTERDMHLSNSKVTALDSMGAGLQEAQDTLHHASLLAKESRDAMLENVTSRVNEVLEFAKNYEINHINIFTQGSDVNLISASQLNASEEPHGASSSIQVPSIASGDKIMIDNLSLNLQMLDEQKNVNALTFEMKDSADAKTDIFSIKVGGNEVYKISAGAASADMSSVDDGSTISKASDLNALATHITEKLSSQGISAFTNGNKISFVFNEDVDASVDLTADAEEIFKSYRNEENNTNTDIDDAVSLKPYTQESKKFTNDMLQVELKSRTLSEEKKLFSIDFLGKKLEVSQSNTGHGFNAASGKLVLDSTKSSEDQLNSFNKAVKQHFGLYSDTGIFNTESGSVLSLKMLADNANESASISTESGYMEGASVSIMLPNEEEVLNESASYSLNVTGNDLGKAQLISPKNIFSSSNFYISLKDTSNQEGKIIINDIDSKPLLNIEFGSADHISGDTLTLKKGEGMYEKLNSLFTGNSKIAGAQDLMNKLQGKKLTLSATQSKEAGNFEIHIEREGLKQGGAFSVSAESKGDI